MAKKVVENAVQMYKLTCNKQRVENGLLKQRGERVDLSHLKQADIDRLLQEGQYELWLMN